MSDKKPLGKLASDRSSSPVFSPRENRQCFGNASFRFRTDSGQGFLLRLYRRHAPVLHAEGYRACSNNPRHCRKLDTGVLSFSRDEDVISKFLSLPKCRGALLQDTRDLVDCVPRAVRRDGANAAGFSFEC